MAQTHSGSGDIVGGSQNKNFFFNISKWVIAVLILFGIWVYNRSSETLQFDHTSKGPTLNAYNGLLSILESGDFKEMIKPYKDINNFEDAKQYVAKIDNTKETMSRLLNVSNIDPKLSSFIQNYTDFLDEYRANFGGFCLKIGLTLDCKRDPNCQYSLPQYQDELRAQQAEFKEWVNNQYGSQTMELGRKQNELSIYLEKQYK